MKVANLCLIASHVLLTPVLGFTDTSPFYSSKQLEGKFPYITESGQLLETIGSLTDDVCKNDNRLVIYRVSNLVHGTKQSEGTYIKHVHYGSAEELDFPHGSSCNGDRIQYLINKQPNVTENIAIAVVDIEDDKEHTIDEFLTQAGGVVIVQGKPSFHRPESKIEGVKHYIEDKVYDNLKMELDLDNVLRKRAKASGEANDDDDDKFSQIMAEVEDDFKAAESFISKEGGEMMMTIMDSSKTDSAGSDAKPPKVKNPNLFTNYTFFSPGIWMCLLISGFLVSVLYITMSWMTSLEISYKAFDKQVDFEKKTE
ncbi:uncharacterized protein AC631_03899 [Debaryomyces fabryi]|uniref:Protein BIG1 n=1 Tax=Debaryomyces fabryi TaxID=58627 RepID=A0A0V1PVQ4_9ASCO|nr:uncharacterized protein AC631_03899 [Debaryomyces fabryi]KSA00334.1 hypothetical protein AC631_03899 [Debaryomyces fabryi]CUM49304.1 unnamed protein product [Debaryomyces fabryi]